MALQRIRGRKEGYPEIQEIRERILSPENFPPSAEGANSKEVLKAATTWYRPLRFREVSTEEARQAVLRQRPVLATFWLPGLGWESFARFFGTERTKGSVLTRSDMPLHPFLSTDPDAGGHAVILTGCAPDSLTFLNSWGYQWGNVGSFSIRDHTILEMDSRVPMRLYDVFWFAAYLLPEERKAYDVEVDQAVNSRANNHPGIFVFEIRCPLCRNNASIKSFKGSIRRAACPNCNQSFEPQPGYLVQALYARAGLHDIE